MTDRYPPPSYAATIWLAGDVIHLALPEAGTVQFDMARPNALNALLVLLKARRSQPQLTIGRAGSALRNDVEKALESDEKYKAWLASMTETKAEAAARKAEAEALLAELDL